MSEMGFHRAIKARRRGMRESIGNRFEAYLPFLAPWQEAQPPGAAVDIGPRSVEWLELLQRQGLRIQDADPCCDTIYRLETLPDASLVVVSAFRVGQIDFADLQTLLAQALRALRPAGLLILETDDSEQRDEDATTPSRRVSPALLALLSAYHGFARAGVLRPPECGEPDGTQTVRLTGALPDAGASRGVVAQKAAAPDILEAFDAPFAGLQVVDLALSALLGDSRRVHARHVADATQERPETRIREAQAASETLRAQLEARLAAAEAARDAALQSWSWRVTAPLRMATSPFLLPTSPLRRGARAMVARGVAACRRLLTFAMGRVLRRPELSERINRWLLGRFPRLHGRLVEVATTGGIIERNPGGTDHAAGSQAAHHGFSGFVAGFLRMPDSELLPPTLRRLGRFHGCQPEERVSVFAGVHLDHDLIHALQATNPVQSRPYDPVVDAACGRQLIRHVFLSLLRRYPSRFDEDQCLNRLAHGERFETLLASVRNSAEHRSIQRWT